MLMSVEKALVDEITVDNIIPYLAENSSVYSGMHS